MLPVPSVRPGSGLKKVDCLSPFVQESLEYYGKWGLPEPNRYFS